MTTEDEKVKNSSIGVVIYNDGSARPNPGFIGWGVHGYLYKIGEEVKKPVIVEGYTITDKGYIDSKSKIEATPVEPIKYFDFLGSSLQQHTNNAAEIKALLYSLERLEEFTPDKVHILTDSEYLRKGITEWCSNWEKFDWKKQDGTSVVNHELWKPLHARVCQLKTRGVDFIVQWVKAHNEVFGNTHADTLAVIGMNHSTAGRDHREFNFSEPKGYWKSDVEKHPFINFKRVYFNSIEKFNVVGTYFQADPGGSDHIIGKRVPETGFAVIKLKDQDPVIEAIKSRQYEVANDVNAIVMMRLDMVYSKDIYPYLVNHGKYCLLTNRKSLGLNFISDKPIRPITVEINPTGLSMRALESFNLLEELLDEHLATRDTNRSDRINRHDITHVFYETEEKLVKKEVVRKTSLKPEFVVGYSNLMITIDEPYNDGISKLKVPLLLGTDLLPRNNLKRLEEHQPRVILITWRESANSLRYATVIECSSGIGIWSNFYADRLFFT